MGVPAFFRWLSRKYPSIIIECVENKQIDNDTNKYIYEDGRQPNPNGVEFDNLYLDMNGIIHPCTHPEDKPAPKNEDEMMLAIFECIDRIMNIVRPRKLLYMAIDGVAPRAKMNQQRSRRFRAAKETIEKRFEIQRIRSELLGKGCVLPPEKKDDQHFDSNCITPGTPFMQRLSQCLDYYIHDRMNNNSAWKDLKVILSDANVPGEGEHKIMEFIRKQRSQPDHNPNTHHVLCGADADLIMLGLATHEPNFTIIREEFTPNKPKPCDICNQFGHDMDKCVGLNIINSTCEVVPADTSKSNNIFIGTEVKFIFLRLSVLREYLRKTLQMPNLSFKYEFERVMDDWVFICFFVGNDFLPHLPSLEIREGAIDRLVELYKKCVYRTGDYLTNSGEVNLERVQMILHDLGNVEDQIFRDRQRREQQYKTNNEKLKRRRIAEEYKANVLEQFNEFQMTPLGKDNTSPLPLIDNYKEAALKLRTQTSATSNPRNLKRTFSQAQLNKDPDDDDEVLHDEVRLWEEGFKDRYYESKFDISKENLDFRYSVALHYVRGLCWVLKYYYQGCPSWNWYFPYHYAPFASDFVNISGLSTQFDNHSRPFNPFEQLMSVFPALSSVHVPQPWAKLMLDPNSDIIDFYPEDFKIDLNGKKFAWQGVALLPFVDEKRLFKALEPLYALLTEEEINRNKEGDCCLYINRRHRQFNNIYKQYKRGILENQSEISILIEGVRGTILKANESIKLKGTLLSPIIGLHNITETEVMTLLFRNPKYKKNFVFPAKRLPNAIDPPNVLPTESRVTNYRPNISMNHNLPQANYTKWSSNTIEYNVTPIFNGHSSKIESIPYGCNIASSQDINNANYNYHYAQNHIHQLQPHYLNGHPQRNQMYNNVNNNNNQFKQKLYFQRHHQTETSSFRFNNINRQSNARHFNNSYKNQSNYRNSRRY